MSQNKIKYATSRMTKFTCISSVLLMVGCASAPYPCGEPGAGKCSSVTNNYQNSFQDYTNPDDLPGTTGGTSRVTGGDQQSSSSSSPKQVFNFKNYAQVPANGSPLLSTPKMLRVWITPYTDNDNIYHDQYYEYMIVDRGSWNFNNNQRLLDDEAGDLMNITQGQVSESRDGGYGAYGIENKPVVDTANHSTQPVTIEPNLTAFPALNMLQNGQAPVEYETHVGSGVDTTTTILP